MAKDKTDTPKEPAVAKVAVPASTAPPATNQDVKAKGKDGVVEAGEAPYNPAAWMHERIVHQIIAFEKELDPDHEVGGRFVEGPNSEALHIETVANWGPDMIVFLGQFPDGRKFELIQHYSQVSLLLVAVPKMNEAPRRIGFELMKTVKNPLHRWGDPIT